MRTFLSLPVLALALALPLAGCQKEAAEGKPIPIAMTDEALGHYCQMYVADHAGPKAQIHLAGFEQPLWFSQVSDAVAYLRDPERVSDIRAVYVSDMGAAASWGDLGADNWIDADGAVYVIESKQMGGMGVPEAIPFSDRQAAQDFTSTEGGRIVGLKEIPTDYVHPGPPPVSDSRDDHSLNRG